MSDSDTIRTFLAIGIPEREREALAKILARFQPEQALLKLVSPDLLHITIRFLGPVPAKRLDAVDIAATAAAAQAKPFTLSLNGIGAFPSEWAPRVVWAGVDGAGLVPLRRLARDLNEQLAAEGFAQDRRAFSPHITLARARDGLTVTQRRQVSDALRRVQAAEAVTGSFQVRNLVIMRSDSGPRGPRYTPLRSVPLGLAG